MGSKTKADKQTKKALPTKKVDSEEEASSSSEEDTTTKKKYCSSQI